MFTRLLLVAALAGLFGLPTAALADHGGSGTVGPWRVGELKIGVSSEADVTAFAGEPDRITYEDNPYTDEEFVVLGYHCGPARCQTSYEITRTYDTFTAFGTRSEEFRTSRGTRVGQSRKRARRQEGRKVRGGCFGYTMTRSSGGRHLVIEVNRRWVKYLMLTGEGAGPYFGC